ncbi:SEC-C metal-binding domain-containing protein [Pseudomonas sp. K5002]|uniref:SEC-C metal-binding domain-containing protein n=1 Tax=Pseudomonas sp. K5002 TaxID=2738828 RepID=UPI0015B94425|nr:SEC-C metal-binding domain-containing protein [Pseudomonas sp. K5002]NWD89918.1 SEC-C domain-containing protein [Pseudomonas sp. K5002]
MLKPLIKEVSVNESERTLARIAEKTFFSLWSYPSLFRDVDRGKELVDLTVFFNNTLILFSDKGHVAFQSDRPTAIAWSRWYRGAIKESAKQLHGAESFIRNHPNRIFLNQKCQDPFPFDISSPDLKIHLVCVTRGIGKAAKAYFDAIEPGSSGTLACVFPLTEKEILERPFLVNDIDPKKTFVHVFDETAIDLLLTELATPTDFISYLKSKENAVRNLKLRTAGGEEDILALYLQETDANGYGMIKNPREDYSIPFSIHETEWKIFRKSPFYALHYAQVKAGRGWNTILKRFSDCIVDATVGEAHDRPLLEHAKVIQALASENMLSRSYLGEQLFEKYEAVEEFARSARLVKSLCAPGRMYVFLFFPWDEDYADYEEYRSERVMCMQLYALVAQYKYPETKEMIVFGSATKGATPGSETILAFDVSYPLTPEERADAQKIMQSHDILNDTTQRTIKRTDIDFNIGRNDKCPCGSGLKYKKCCA